MRITVRAALTGKVAPLGRRGVASGIDKQPVEGAIAIRSVGLSGDAQGDRRHHGGPDKAIHHYAFDHYLAWRTEYPALAWRLMRPGAFGENISTLGLTEADVCIGDVLRFGTALVQVSQARQPCWRLNERFKDPHMARRVQDSGRTGWYYRVLEPGQIAAGDALTLVERSAEGWTLEHILHILNRDMLNSRDLSRLAELPQLTASWRALARRRLETHTVENWSRRLNMPEEAVS